MAVITRRAVLTGGAGAAGAAALGFAAAAAAATPPPLARLAGPRAADTLVRSRFLPLVGDQFSADGGELLTLASVDDVQGAPAGDEFRFNLVFEPARSVGDGIYTLRHPRTNDSVLFLSKFGDQGAAMQAVVNRIA
jgi:hypothetical protein